VPVLNLNTDARTRRVVDLLTKLATPHEPFLQPWEYEKWLAVQEEIFFELYRKHQDNYRVLTFLKEIDGGSRNDARFSDPVRRAIPLAGHYLGLVLQDIGEQNTCPALPPTGHGTFDAWTDGAQVVHQNYGSEWGRQAVREANKRIEYEIGPEGYVREKRK
jgi:hypothetical protein